jgi:hypothetical protein
LASIEDLETGESLYPSTCLTCGGDVISHNGGKDGVCAKCGPVAFDVVRRSGHRVEGFSADAWQKADEYMTEVNVRRSKDLEAEISALLSRRSFPVNNLERRHPVNAFDILPGLPPYGPRALSFPENGRGFFSEGLVVQFLPSGREAWIGNFQRGSTGPDTVLEHPDQQHILVVSGGVGYIVDPETATLTHQLSGLIKQVIPAPDLGAIVLGDDMKFEAVRADGLWWQSGRISWDGFRKIVKSGTILTGESYSTLDQVWSPFALDLTTGAFAGGSTM